MADCILYQNSEKTITLFDIPRSLELAQGRYDTQSPCRIISSTPLDKPFPSVEPKSAKALANQVAPSLAELLLQRHLQLALEELQGSGREEWCLPRVLGDGGCKKRKRDDESQQLISAPDDAENVDDACCTTDPEQSLKAQGCATEEGQAKSYSPSSVMIPKDKSIQMNSISTHLIPPGSKYIKGNIEETCTIFDTTACLFDLVILDPPWPNRSARRKRSYSISYGTEDIAALLTSIPLHRHLAIDAFVGIWVTNKAAFRDLILSPGGLFDQWDVELVEEWIWLKITSSGEPICSLAGTWRKPYEILLVGKKRSVNGAQCSDVKKRVVAAVPDLHSRKPNLKALFEPMLPLSYEALEIFARNLTTGWLAWGNEVLKFQHKDQWISQ